MRRLQLLLVFAALVLSHGACRETLSDATPGGDTLELSDGISFGDASDDSGGGGGDLVYLDTPWVPEGHARITFYVDDRANETFQDGDMKWTGSFAWSDEDNTIVPASSWLPTDGPFPLLYDDGPVTEGGHEMAEAEAGDHVFSTEVYFKADEETTFQYGVLNELDFWMWEGPNGTFTIPAGSTGTVHAAGLALAEFGTIDVKVTVDTNDLHPDFAYIQEWPGVNVYLKGNMNMWTPVQVLDNGPDGGKGDDVEGDGVYTYVQGLNLGKHTGLLQQGQHAQFTAMFSAEEDSWVQAAEYKILLEGKQKGAKNGIAAFTRCGDGDWVPAEVTWEVDSWGTTENTTVEAACDFVPECGTDDDCGEGEICQDGICVADAPVILGLSPAWGSVVGGTVVAVEGAGFTADMTVEVGGEAAAFTLVDAGLAEVTTPPNPAGVADIAFTFPGGGSAGIASAFEYVLIGSPTVDGDLADWDPLYQVAENSVPSDWDPGLNSLSSLYLAYDDVNLYVGVGGYAESANYILGYVDADFGASTGVADMGALTDDDGDGDLNDALSNVITVTAAGFGAEFGFGAQGGAAVAAGDLEPAAGWRSLTPPDSFTWIAGHVDQGAAALETSAALEDLLGDDGIPPAGLQIAVAVKLSNKYGGADGMSNQCLPECSAPAVIDQVAVITLR